MTLTIPDEALKASGMSEGELLIELACHLYDVEKLTKSQASRMVGMTRDEFNAELTDRGLAVIHYTADDLNRDVQTAQRNMSRGTMAPEVG